MQMRRTRPVPRRQTPPSVSLVSLVALVSQQSAISGQNAHPWQTCHSHAQRHSMLGWIPHKETLGNWSPRRVLLGFSVTERALLTCALHVPRLTLVTRSPIHHTQPKGPWLYLGRYCKALSTKERIATGAHNESVQHFEESATFCGPARKKDRLMCVPISRILLGSSIDGGEQIENHYLGESTEDSNPESQVFDRGRRTDRQLLFCFGLNEFCILCTRFCGQNDISTFPSKRPWLCLFR